MGSSEGEEEVGEEAGVGSMEEEVGGIGTIIIMEIGTIIMEVVDGEIVKITIMVEEVGAIGIVITTIVEVGVIEITTITGIKTTTIAQAAQPPTNPINAKTVSTLQVAAAQTVQDPRTDHLPALYNSTNPRKPHNSSV